MQEEVNLNVFIEPFKALSDIAPPHEVAAIHCHPIWEQLGGDYDWTCRVIDILLTGVQISTAASEYTLVPTDVDGLAVQGRVASLAWPDEQLQGFASDVCKADKQDTLCPS